jgi:hypothetical protein
MPNAEHRTVEQRMLPIRKAAKYCGEPFSTFQAVCPARPIKLHERAKPRYDIFDLDEWIDFKKSGVMQEGSDDEIIEKL